MKSLSSPFGRKIDFKLKNHVRKGLFQDYIVVKCSIWDEKCI